MNFKSFLKEGGPGFQKTNLTIDEIYNKLISYDYSGAYNNLKKCGFDVHKGSLFRGTMNLTDYKGEISTNSTTRYSENTHNAYTLCFDANPDNANYPKRSKSIICSTDIDFALSYGVVYVLFPRHDAKIGILSAEDMFFSSGELFGYETTNYEFNTQFVPNFIDVDSIRGLSFDKLISKMINKKNDIDPNTKFTNLASTAALAVSDEEFKKGILDFCNFSKQGAAAFTGNSLINYNDFVYKEAWCEGTCLMVPLHEIEELQDKLKSNL